MKICEHLVRVILLFSFGYLFLIPHSSEASSYYKEARKYHEGNGVKSNVEKAFELYGKAYLEQESIPALFEAGKLLYEGKKVKINTNAGLQMLVIAADKGSSNAMMYLGQLSLKNNALEYAEEYFSKAKKGGNIEGAYKLGLLYLDSENDKLSSINKAIENFKLAQDIMPARSNHALLIAYYKKGILYHKGDGVPKDKIESEKWFSKGMPNLRPKDDFVTSKSQTGRNSTNVYNPIVSDPSDFWGECGNGGVYSGICSKTVFGPVYCTVAGPNGGDGYSQLQSAAIMQACGE